MGGMPNNTLKQLCTDENKIKDVYYGSIHRAVFSINKEKGEWDILQISIPFSPLKEAELMRRFGMDRSELPTFYANFEKAVVRHSSLIQALHDTDNSAIQKSIVSYKSVQYFPRIASDGRQIGQDFYFITSPLDIFVGSNIIHNHGACLRDINNLAIRLLQTAKTFNDYGFTVGAIDLDSCFFADEDGRKYMKLGYSFYGTGPGIKPDKYTPDVKPFVQENVVSGSEQNLDSDVRMICSYIWNLLDGSHYTEPSQNAWIAYNFYSESGINSFPQNLFPAFAPDQLAKLLFEGMTKGAASMKTLQSGIRAINKQLATGELANPFIPFTEPSYLKRELPELRKGAAEETEEQNKNQEAKDKILDKSVTSKKKKPKKGGIAIAVLAAIGFLGAAAYLLAGPSGLLSEYLNPPVVTSSSEGVYVAERRVLNEDATANTHYILDEDGNLLLQANPEKIVYPADRVSEYIFVDDIEVSIIDKKFTRDWNIAAEDRILKDNVVDLRGVDGLLYNSMLGEDNVIPYALVKEHGINDETLILVKDKNYPELNYKVAMLVKQEAQEGESTVESQTEAEPAEPAFAAIRAVNSVSEDNLYKLQGEWNYTVTLDITPENAIDRKITLTSEDPEQMYFVVTDKNGAEMKTKTVKMSVKANQENQLRLVGTVEGKYVIKISSDDGSVSKRVSMKFEPASDYTAPELPAQPTATPEPTPTPTPWTTQTTAPTPVPIVTPSPPSYTQPNYGGGYSNPYPQPLPTTYHYEEPVYTPDPIYNPDPVYTPEPVLPLTCYIDHIDLKVGDTYRLGDALDGIENTAALRCWTTVDGIVVVSPSEGFLITAVNPGETAIDIQKASEYVEVTVSVY